MMGNDGQTPGFLRREPSSRHDVSLACPGAWDLRGFPSLSIQRSRPRFGRSFPQRAGRFPAVDQPVSERT